LKEEAAGRSKEGAAAGLGEEEAAAGGRGEEGRCSRGRRGVQQSAVAAGGSGSDFEEEHQGREVQGATGQGEKKQQ